MRRTIIASAALVAAFSVSPAYAADMPVKAPILAPAPVANWTGWNLGISLGARFADVTGTSLSFGGGPVPNPLAASQSYDSTAFRIGGYLGYDWQIAPQWLVGLEGDFAWGSAKKHVDALQGIALSNTGSYSEFRQVWDASIRGRVGYLLDPTWLIYATGGVSWLHVEATESCGPNTCGPLVIPLGGAPYTQTNSTTRTGWTIGAGLEKMLADRWLVRGEYRYADYGKWTTTFGGAPQVVKEFSIATHTALLGIAKKF